MGTVRVRATLGATLVVAVALLVAGFALVVVLRDTLVNDRREVAEARADEVVALLETTATASLVAIPDVDDQWVQVLDPSGTVIAASAKAAGRPAIVRLEPDTSAEIQADVGDESSYIAAAAAAETPEGQLVVIVGRGLDDVVDSTEILAALLRVGLPVLLVVMALTTYLVVGRALAPVEAIRREVDGISSRDLDRRVVVPDRADEVSRLALTMNRMLGRLAAAQDRQRRFVSDAAHELRSPIASIRQHSEVALAHSDDGPAKELAATVLEENLRLQRLVEDLILLARSDEQIQAAAQDVDLDDIVFEEAQRLRGTTSLEVDTTAVSGGQVRGDSIRLRRMIANLAENARRHARTRVVFSLAGQPDGSVLLQVDDDGNGIPEGDRERVFERFVRLDDARARDVGGSGLGLAIVAEVATAHGGSVTAADSPSGGARLEVRLPRPAD
ncbi:MAG: sensor histidine kinase [Candidatus Limnocylindrales bacterium]